MDSLWFTIAISKRHESSWYCMLKLKSWTKQLKQTILRHSTRSTRSTLDNCYCKSYPRRSRIDEMSSENRQRKRTGKGIRELDITWQNYTKLDYITRECMGNVFQHSGCWFGFVCLYLCWQSFLALGSNTFACLQTLHDFKFIKSSFEAHIRCSTCSLDTCYWSYVCFGWFLPVHSAWLDFLL